MRMTKLRVNSLALGGMLVVAGCLAMVLDYFDTSCNGYTEIAIGCLVGGVAAALLQFAESGNGHE